jgi:hypothetical protein
MYKSVFLFLILATIVGCTSQENKLPAAEPGKSGYVCRTFKPDKARNAELY